MKTTNEVNVATNIQQVANDFSHWTDTLIVVGPNLTKTNETAPRWSMRLAHENESVPFAEIALSNVHIQPANKTESPRGCQFRAAGCPVDLKSIDLQSLQPVTFRPSHGDFILNGDENHPFYNLNTLLLREDGAVLGIA